MPTFPLKSCLIPSYHLPPRAFASRRDNGKRSHAGCDLYTSEGSDVVACEAGTVIRGPVLYYQHTVSIEIRHANGAIARYCELGSACVQVGDAVTEGQVIGKVGSLKLEGLPSMLHFELFAGLAKGNLTNLAAPPFMRRGDLLNPTEYLDRARGGI